MRPAQHSFSRFLAPMLMAAVLTGCGDDEDTDYEPEQWRGHIDETLSKEDQEKQQALIDVFDKLNREVVFTSLDEIRHTTFEETEDEFYGDESIKQLHRWDWNGASRGDDFPVRLVFLKEEPDAEQFEEVKVERVYTITERGGYFTISRKE